MLLDFKSLHFLNDQGSKFTFDHVSQFKLKLLEKNLRRVNLMEKNPCSFSRLQKESETSVYPLHFLKIYPKTTSTFSKNLSNVERVT